MQNIKNIIESIIINGVTDVEPVDSYVKLVKFLSNTDDYKPEILLDRLNVSEFTEDIETTYRSYPIKVLYKQLPIVIDGEVLVKVVVLIQADSYALIIPENISETYKELLDNPELIDSKNIDFSLYAEVYNFDSDDSELLELIKEVYLAAGNSLKAFELVGSLKVEPEMEKEESEEEADPFKPANTDFSAEDFSEESFSEIEAPVEDFSEVEENYKAFKKFKKQSAFLESLVKKLYTMSNKQFKENIRIKFLNNKSILAIEVDNKSVYRKFEHVPAIAKKSLSIFGEAIRKNDSTQLVDSFVKDGKRYFIVVESAGNNFWYVSKEEMSPLDDSKDIIKPIQKDIIKLNRSSVRQESRKFIPCKKDKEIVFLKK